MSGRGANAGYVDGFEFQREGRASWVLAEHRHLQGDGDALQAGGTVHPSARVAGKTLCLVDELGHPVSVEFLTEMTLQTI